MKKKNEIVYIWNRFQLGSNTLLSVDYLDGYVSYFQYQLSETPLKYLGKGKKDAKKF